MPLDKEEREIVMAEAAEKLARKVVDAYDIETMTDALVELEAAAYLKNEEKMLEDWEQEFPGEQFPVESIFEHGQKPDSPPRTLAQLAKEAVDVQDTVNLLGVSKSFAKAMLDLNHYVSGSVELRTHFITCLWVSKLASLNGGFYDHNFSAAYDWCLEKAKDVGWKFDASGKEI